MRHILTAPHGLRIAVILNEFGEGVENAYFQDIKVRRRSCLPEGCSVVLGACTVTVRSGGPPAQGMGRWARDRSNSSRCLLLLLPQGLRDTSGEWVELDNGCMCCSVKSEFVQALEALLAKEKRPDYILIETTGEEAYACWAAVAQCVARRGATPAPPFPRRCCLQGWPTLAPWPPRCGRTRRWRRACSSTASSPSWTW